MIGLLWVCSNSSQKIDLCCHPFRFETLDGNRVLQLDPTIDGVFKGPYPIGIDPVNIFLYDLYSDNSKYKLSELLLVKRQDVASFDILVKHPLRFVA